MSGFYRDIVLPSNGLLYDPFVSVKPLTFKFMDVMTNYFYSSNITEMYTAILREHIRSSIDVRDMLFCDVFFLWTMLYADAMNSDSITVGVKCSKCDKRSPATVPISDLNVNYNMPGLYEKLITIQTGEDSSISFNRRRARDNVLTATMIMKYGGDISLMKNSDIIKSFYMPQLNHIRFNGEIYNSADGFDLFIKYHGNNLISRLMELMRVDDIGIQNDFEYTCDNCNTQNDILIYDPIQASIYFVQDESESEKRSAYSKKFIDTKIHMINNGGFSEEEVDNIPFAKLEEYFDAVASYKKSKSNVKDYFDDMKNPLV